MKLNFITSIFSENNIANHTNCKREMVLTCLTLDNTFSKQIDS